MQYQTFHAKHSPAVVSSAEFALPFRKRALVTSLFCAGFLLGTGNVIAAGGDTQASATVITSLPYNDSGTTVGATDNYDLPSDTVAPTLTATCATTATGAGPAGSLPRGAVYTGTGTGPDVVYSMSFPAGNPDTLTITLDPTGSEDLALIVYCDTCSSNLSDGLAVSDTGAGGAAETVTVAGVTAGSTLYIVVDGYSVGATPPGPSGAYTLSVTSNGSTQPGVAADLSITKTDGVVSATPGGSTTYTITASNAGPSAAGVASVADTFPAACASVSWTSVAAGGATGNTASGSGNINDTTLNLPVGASVTYTATCNISPSATGTLANTATVSSSVIDPTPANNSATDTDTLTASADLSITKTDGVVSATPGGSTTYTITASNAGPSAAGVASVADTFPAACASVSWTSVAAGGATGNTASGSGNINDTTLNLPVGSSVTYTATCNISPSATGTLANTATVSSSVTDPTPANNSATDTDTLAASADLSITKTDGAVSATPGSSTIYTITASNAGPSAAGVASVTDTFPAACASVSWTSVAAGGATGNTASGSGNINDTTLNLPVGSSVTYTATCNIDPAASGTLANTATVSNSVTDPTPANNSATDSDTLVAVVAAPIPTLSPWGFAAMLASLFAVAATFLRRGKSR